MKYEGYNRPHYTIQHARILEKPTVSFKNACEFVGLLPTKRQWSKYCNKKGAAFKKIVMNEKMHETNSKSAMA